IAARDTARLPAIGEFGFLVRGQSSDSLAIDYRSIPDSEKPAWVAKVFAALDEGGADWNDGHRIEAAASFAEAIKKIESRPSMLALIGCDLEGAIEADR